MAIHIGNRLSSAYDDAGQLKYTRNKCAFLLLKLLTSCTLWSWQYPYHLGIFGVYELFKDMVKYWRDKPGGQRNRLFVIGELPEELTSYRHMIAHWLKRTDICHAEKGERIVHAMTGDLGLHIQLKDVRGGRALQPMVRCTFCNYNNETILKGENYHLPSKIIETPVKRLQASMIYLCTVKDHHPECPGEPRHFINSPELRVI